MKYFVFRNYTVEPFFKGMEVTFSGYEDISYVEEEAERYIWFYQPSFKTDQNSAATEIRNYGEMLGMVAERVKKDKMLLIFTMYRVYDLNFQTIRTEVKEAILEYNKTIERLTRQYENLKIVDMADFLNKYSGDSLVDWKYYFISQIPLNPRLAGEFHEWFGRQVEMIELKRKKCVVLDLDNTLWGGVLGEEGVEGIRLGEGYPGNTYRFFQQYLLELSRNGILLTVCSKNNEADVLEVWEKHPEMILRKDQFVTYRINWNNKADNIREIAEELNIGLDSLVFIDDNPTERELVKQVLPMVCVPDFPEHPYQYPRFVRQLTDDCFRIYRLTDEDLSKTQQYKENAERSHFQHQFTDMESYLRSLQMELTFESVNDYNVVRMAQMTQKTNQFNLTTRRYTETDIRNFERSGGKVWGIRVKDRFGDSGLTGLAIVRIQNDEAFIDTFLLSCRILGKNIEEVFVRYVLHQLQLSGVKKVRAIYQKTLKNAQVREFYDRIGLSLVRTDEEVREYEANLEDLNLQISDIYKLSEK